MNLFQIKITANNKIKISTFFLKTFTLFMIFCIHLDAECQNKEKKHQFIIYLTTPTMTTIRDGKSPDPDIENKAWMAEIGMGTKLFQIVGISGATGLGSIKDNNSFTQNTTAGTLESTFTTLCYDFKAGLWTPEIKLIKSRDLKLSVGTSIGIEGFSGKREIEDCIDCIEEKYEFKGGFFVEPELNLFFFQDLIGLGTSYRHFFDGSDLKNSWTILKIMIKTNF